MLRKYIKIGSELGKNLLARANSRCKARSQLSWAATEKTQVPTISVLAAMVRDYWYGTLNILANGAVTEIPHAHRALAT
jgi:hypothetical protein